MAATKTRVLAPLLASLVLLASCSQSSQRAVGPQASPLAFMPSSASLGTTGLPVFSLGQGKGETLAGLESRATAPGPTPVHIESMGPSILDSLRQSRSGPGFNGAQPLQPRAPGDGLVRQRLGGQASQLSGHYGLLDNRVQVVFSNAEGADITQSGKIMRAPFAREGSRASKGEWHRDALLKFDAIKSEHLTLGVTGGFYDEQTTLYDGGRLNIGKATGWRKHQAQEGGLTLGVLNNQLRYSGQFALSTSQEQAASDGSVASDSGHGYEQRIDADLWKSEAMTLSVYGRYKEAQSAYESSSTWAEAAFDLEDSFGFVADDDKAIGDLEGKGETLGFGGAIAFGDGDLSYSQTDKRYKSGGSHFKNEISGTYDWDYAAFSASREEVLAFDEGESEMLSTTYGGEIGFKADRVLALLDVDASLGSLFPNLLRVKASDSTHQDQDDKNARPDSETTIGLGASWEWDMGEIDIDVSRTVYDSNNENGSDQTEHALEISQKVTGDDWDVFGYAELSQSREKQQKDEISDWTFSGGLDFSYAAEGLPDLTLSFGYDWLRQDDESFNYTEESHTWSLGSTLYLDEFVPVFVPGDEPHFGLSLYLQNDRLDDSDSGRTQDWSYFFMVTSGLKF